MNFSKILSRSQRPLGFILLVLALLVTLIMNTTASGPANIYLPILVNGDAPPFTPTTDTTLGGGSYIFSDFIIPANVTVTVLGDLTVLARGETDIAGMLTADCTAVTFTGQGNVTVTGTVRNTCSGADDDAGDLTIYKTGSGEMNMGTDTAVAHLHSSGNIDVSNDPAIQQWEFDVLPHQRASSPNPPVCAAEADTVIGTTTADFPLEIAFFGAGADPDGGPVSYQWDFDDGHTATEKEPLHTYTGWGAYTVTLTVTDDEGDTCTATLSLTLDDNASNTPATPGGWQSPTTLVAAAGEVVYFLNGGDDPFGEDLSFDWQFGDSLSSSEPAPTHTYSLPGVYPVSLTVTNEGGWTTTATSSLYVYEAPAQQTLQLIQGGACVGAGAARFNVAYDAGQAGAGKNGRSVTFRGRGNAWVGPGTDIQAQHGGNGLSRAGAGFVQGGPGGKGGSLQILVNGTLTICTGASLKAGNGGDGGSAISNTPAPGHAQARGGRGGRAASLFRISATQGITINAAAGGNVTINPGSGGAGGSAEANGGDGLDLCPTGQNGATAKATGGNGGNASKTSIVSRNIPGIGNVLVIGGKGGAGGNATAEGGDGGWAICPAIANGGLGGWAEARGGRGGDARLSGALNGIGLAADAFTAGDGGQAEADGGDGGRAEATPSAPCEDTTATGGNGGRTWAYGGLGAKGRQNGAGGDANAYGGDGGDAEATGGDCPGCDGEGGSATATGGTGANAHARRGKGEPNGVGSAWGGYAGDALATGGQGGDCDECPGGDGGNGGAADATGRNGGTATGGDNNTGGDGGDADAYGGNGGQGADCACDKFEQEAGGDGGDGGGAVASAGESGLPVGADGTSGGSGGNGGHGGDGLPPGAGGAGGAGTGTPQDIPDGLPGDPGAVCEIQYVIWYIYHSSIPDGPILPGSVLPLETFTQTVPVNPTGVVPVRFMMEGEVGFPPLYFKNGAQLQVHGGLDYSFAEIPPTQFPIISFEARNVQHGCPMLECVVLLGYSQGVLTGMTSNQQTGPGAVETLTLPMPPPGLLYDQVQFISLVPMSFLHWEIVIIDP